MALHQVKMMSDASPIHIQLRHQLRILRILRTFAGLLVRRELGIDEQAVLQIVNAEFGRFSKTNRAQMSGHLRPRLWAAKLQRQVRQE